MSAAFLIAFSVQFQRSAYLSPSPECHLANSSAINTFFVRNIVALKALIKLGADGDLKCYGTPVLHLVLGIAALPGGFDFGMAAFAHLLAHVDTTTKVDGYCHLKPDQSEITRVSHLLSYLIQNLLYDRLCN